MDVKKIRELTNEALFNVNIDEYILNIENKIKNNASNGLYMTMFCIYDIVPSGKNCSAIVEKIVEHFTKKGFKITDRNPFFRIE